MKKNITGKGKQKVLSKSTKTELRKRAAQERLTIGIDLGDRTSRYCILNEAGEVMIEAALPTRKTALNSVFEKMPSSRVALEVGTHSPWVSRQLAELGHEVIVANARRVKLIAQSTRKDDRMDAEKLARLARVDPKLLAPIRHRSEQAQADLAVIRARSILVEARTKLINSANGLTKSTGDRLPKCGSEQVSEMLADGLSEGWQEALGPLLKSVEQLSEQISQYDQQLTAMEARYPEVELLKQIYGVGTLIALTFLLTIEDPQRFAHSRDVGAYLGMQPKRRESGSSQPELGISKEGDRYLRSLLIQAAHCVLKRGAPDTDVRRWGLGKIGKGGKKAKKRVVVAVARKLAVLLHHLWVSGEVYDPLYNASRAKAAAA
jgi:transposase